MVGVGMSPEDVHRPTRLAIVDDHELARESLQNMLSDEIDIEIVGEAANGRQALSLCSRLRPDLILMDVRMPEMDGLAATKEVKQRYPKVSVMMLTMHENPDYLLEALQATCSKTRHRKRSSKPCGGLVTASPLWIPRWQPGYCYAWPKKEKGSRAGLARLLASRIP